MRQFKLRTLFFFICLFFFNNVFSQGYFGDFNFEIKDDNSINSELNTNNDKLNSKNFENFITQDEKNFIFNFTHNEFFSVFIYTIIFPQDTKINYMDLGENFNIEIVDNKIVISGFLEEVKPKIYIEYEHESSSTFKNYFMLFSLIIFILCVLSSLYYYIKIKKIKNNRDHFPKRQQDILEILDKNNGKISQDDLNKIMLIPKSSISRNIHSLEQKSIIKIERFGHRKWIFKNKN